ncbi:MAG: carbamoyltransferase C-terminal domain-containing protein [Nanoarchaeota archaeon]
MKVLGIHSFTHDVGVALAIDGRIAYAVEEERLSRNKHHLGIEAEGTPPYRSLEFVLSEAGLTLDNIDRIVHVGWEGSDYLKMDFAGSRYRAFAKELDPTLKKTGFISHHLAHAASAYFSSGFSRALVLSIDGVGDFVSTSLWLGEGGALKKIDQYMLEDSIGFLYSKASRLLGLGKFGYGEGKMTALAAYGHRLKDFPNIISLENGRYSVRQDYPAIFQPFERANPDLPFTQEQKDFAATIQLLLEETVEYILDAARKKYPEENLVMSGGVALNCRMNGRLSRIPWVKSMFIMPGANDAGVCIGAAYLGSQETGDKPQKFSSIYIGPDIDHSMLEEYVLRNQLNAIRVDDPSAVAVSLLVEGNTIAWVQGRLEFGPRALGHRSLLGDPRSIRVRDRLNEIKQRESWRPVAPAIIVSNKEYCDYNQGTEFMTKAIPMSALAREEIPGGIHIDGTARVQMVKDVQDSFYQLILAFEEKTGIPAVLNTSLNARDEPLCTSIDDAVRFYYTTPTDHLIIGNWWLRKK